MAINKAMRAALKALSYPEPNVKKTYKLERQLDELSKTPKTPPITYRMWNHIVYSGSHSIPVRLFAPKRPESCGVLVFFHGGGWVKGNIDSYSGVCANMAKLTGRLVVSVDYRLAPEYTFPAAAEDCYAVTRELFLDSRLLGVSTSDIALIGDSAGGNLAAVVSLMARDRGDFLPSKQILIYPATYNDHSEMSPFESVRTNGTDYLLTSRRVEQFMQLYCPDPEEQKNPYFAPLLAESLRNQPYTLVITAEYDPLRDEGEAYAKRLRDDGGICISFRMPDALHGFFALPARFAQVKRAYSVINDFLNEVGVEKN